MGNIGSNGGGRRRTHSVHGDHHAIAPPHALPPPPPPPQPDAGGGGNRYVFAAASPYPPQYPNPPPPPYYHYPGYFPAPPPPPPFLHRGPHDPHVLSPPPPPWGRYGPGMPPAPVQPPPPYIEHQEAVTIRNDVNVKKETLRVEPDEGSPGKFLVAFTFDATIAGSITVVFFAKEGIECNLMPMKESLLPPVSVSFEKGLSQKFRQPSGSGIDFSIFDETELSKEGEMEVYPLAVKAETCSDDQGSTRDNQQVGTPNSQITQAVFEKKDNGEYHAKVVKQILWVAGVRYELQEIYGIGNSVDNEFDGNDPGKECVICLSEPRDTTVLPCRHMCMCSECAKVLRFQTNRCPICRQPVERLLEIKVNNKSEEENGSVPVD